MSSNWFEVNLTEPNPEKCMIKVKNETILTDLYQGIPQTLVLNIIAWLLLIILFTILRHQAWDYGRLALVNSNGNKKRWTQIFYAHGNEDGGGVTTDNGSNGSSSGGGGGGNIGINGSGGSISTTTTTPITQNHHTHIDHGIFSWMLVTFKLKKDQILMHSGPDAVHYLSFQQHLMCVMGIITFISIVIILPINFHGNLSGDANSFGHTTLSNLDPNSSVLWVHVIISILYAPLVVLIMRRSSGRNAFKKAPIRTIMITNISPSDRNKMIIRNYMQELFPDVNIEDIQLAYNIKKLTETNEDYERVSDARQYCEEHRNRNLLRATPHWYNCKTVPAYDYYVKEEQRLAGEVARLRASALNEPLGIAFITVSTVLEAQNIILHFRPGTYRNWNLSFAPSPSDIFWENINVSASKWYLKYAIVNIILFLVLFFLTTPAIIVNALDTLTRIKGSIYRMSPLVSEFLPTLMLWILSALMPVIVAYSDKWLSHWTRSQQNYSIMTKSFGYLLFMILILPSLGLTSAQAFLEWTINRTESYRWECIFLPDKGAFFVNYVITSSFIGTILELIRFPELIVYMWFLCTAKSRAETSFIRRSILIEFPFGIHYAWTVLVFTMSTVYSVACPLIMPFAMVYICFKHFVDRHNLYFSYGPSNMISQNGGKIHSTAVTMTKFSIVILLTIMGAITAVRGQGIDAKSIVLIISLFLTLTLFTFMSPIKRCALKRPSITEVSGPAPIYIADVLFNNKPPRHSDSGNTINGYGSDTQRCASENEIHNNLNIDNSSDDIPVAI